MLPAVDLRSLWVDHGQKFLRYSGVSVFNVIMGQSLLLLFYRVLDQPAWQANLWAVAIGTLPSYLLARRFVWAKTGKHSFTREVLPFWSLNLLGTLLSTLAVHFAEQATSGNVVAVTSASIFAWLTVWVVKYLLLDRTIFAANDRELASASVTV